MLFFQKSNFHLSSPDRHSYPRSSHLPEQGATVDLDFFSEKEVVPWRGGIMCLSAVGRNHPPGLPDLGPLRSRVTEAPSFPNTLFTWLSLEILGVLFPQPHNMWAPLPSLCSLGEDHALEMSRQGQQVGLQEWGCRLAVGHRLSPSTLLAGCHEGGRG